MIDHLLIYSPASTHAATVAFYASTLAPLGYTKSIDMFDSNLVGFGVNGGRPDFWVASYAMKEKQGGGGAVTFAHIAFKAEERRLVNECYAKGLAAGGKDNGPPGLRPMYHADYYGGFLIDPAGNPMEVVCRTD